MTGNAGRRFAAGLAGPFVVLLATAGTVLVYRLGDDFRTGRADPTDGLPVAAAFLLLGLYTDALPSLWRRFDGRPAGGLVAPVYGVLTLFYLYCACRIGFVQPGATAAAVLGHVLVVVFLLLNGD